MGKSCDRARQYCTRVEKSPHKIRCIFCGHTMSGITRFKEHLACKRGDVIPCRNCPPEVSNAMTQELIQLSFQREEKERRTREALQSAMAQNQNQSPSPNPDPNPNLIPPPPPTYPPAQQPLADNNPDEEDEKILMQALEESLLTYEVEKRKTEEEIDNDIAAARQESIRHYIEECHRRGGELYGRGEGTSAGPSNASYDRAYDYSNRR
ncbi:hypothetical protein ACOSP7_012716 [Xanthoceras sorbifolium]|uniref:BED-type domain-containing protein n=1 Tax=Xanthoceras sorbifolium TaxID=99658 RepID=A0ABQ8HYE3_9ROSI|nr:hypothetical protein JRO89_XS06G0148600 [Xanthoceras sorbifolium]